MSEASETLPVTAAAEPGAGKLIFTLTLAGLISGLALVGIYEITLPTIKENNAKAIREAVYKVVPGSSSMQKLVLEGNSFVVAKESDESPGIYAAYDKDKKFIGYAIEGDGPGFQDVIRLLYGFNSAKQHITGMEILESKETPGLGDKIFKDEAFVKNFSDLAIKPEVVVVKNGKSSPNEVDAITGATISSKAVVKIINVANSKWLSHLPSPGSEPPLNKPKTDGQNPEKSEAK